MDNLLTVHFHSMHGDYSRYSMWKWLDGYWGEEAHFSREDDFGLVGQVTSPSNRFIDSVNLLVKNGRLVEANTLLSCPTLPRGCSQCYLDS